MKNNTLKISVSLIIILFSFVQITTAEDYMMFSVCTNGCHTERGINYGISENEWCGTCHLYVSKDKIDIGAMEEKHNPKVCKLCHTVQDTKEYHMLHRNVTESCTKCHGKNGQSSPSSRYNDCVGCHSSKIHEIHENNLDQICLKCHGVSPAKTPQNSMENPTEQIYATVVDYQKFTLLELFKRLLGMTK